MDQTHSVTGGQEVNDDLSNEEIANLLVIEFQKKVIDRCAEKYPGTLFPFLSKDQVLTAVADVRAMLDDELRRSARPVGRDVQ
jgi:hypothetical protein